jgi:hypothetical protein
MPLKMIRNDITKVSADAIVNTANPKPIYAAGTDRAIYEAAGAEQLLAERKKIGDIKKGEVAVTEAYQLSGRVMGRVQSFIDANYVKTRRESEYNRSRDLRRMESEDVAAIESVQFKLPEPDMMPVGMSLDDQFASMGGSFQEKLFELIDNRGLSNVEVYTRANLDRKHFSKIQCNANYHPSKKTAMALCIALKLDLEESKDLLARAEWAFSPNRKLDLIVMNAIVNHEYNINQVNAVLFEYGQDCLGV